MLAGRGPWMLVWRGWVAALRSGRGRCCRGWRWVTEEDHTGTGRKGWEGLFVLLGAAANCLPKGWTLLAGGTQALCAVLAVSWPDWVREHALAFEEA